MAQCAAINAVEHKENFGLRCSRSAVTGSEFCTHHGGLIDTKTPSKVRRRVDRPRQQCRRWKANNEQCKNWAVAGTTVCNHHGAKAAHIKAKAQQRMFEAVDPVMSKMIEIALDDSRGSAQVRAAEFLLERSGFSLKHELTVEMKPWEKTMQEILVDAEAEVELVNDVETVPGGRNRYELEITERAALQAAQSDEVIAKVVPLEVVANPTPPAHIREGLQRRQG